MAMDSMAASPAQSATQNKRMNVLFIVVDDLRPVLGCYGDTIAETPAFDQLAGRSLRFSNAYSQVAMCGPSRASLISGLRPMTTGFLKHGKGLNGYIKNERFTILPEHFKNNGYSTKAVGKIHHWYEKDSRPGDWSEPWFEGKVNGSLSPYKVWADQDHLEHIVTAGKDPNLLIEIADRQDSAYGEYALADEAIRSMSELRKNPVKPFFIALGFYRPHIPWIAPKRYYDIFNTPEKNRLIDAAYLTLRNGRPFNHSMELPVGAPAYVGNSMNYSGFDDTPPNGCDGLDMEGARHWIRAYYASVKLVDSQLKRVLDYLTAENLWGNTIIILTADHGFHLADHGNLWAKQTVFRDATRVPLLVYVPGMKTFGQISDAPVELVDIYPTLSDLAGLALPDQPDGMQLAGQSLRPLLDDVQSPWKEAAFHHWLSPSGKDYVLECSVSSRRYRYSEGWRVRGVGNDIQGGLGCVPDDPALYLDDHPVGIELYDHVEDPRETVNLAVTRKKDADIIKLINTFSEQLSAERKREQRK